MTKRIINGLSHPKAKILGHPTGRLLDRRAGYEIDWDLLFDYCKSMGKYLEINSWPNRLDLPDTIVKTALEKDVGFVINTDAHAVDQLDLMQYGVSVARRGWAEAKNIINTFDLVEIEKCILT
jgi:DNA polymerase (family 10)